MSGYLTTHVLDTARGQPAAGLAIALDRIAGEARERLAEAVTNGDGRTDAPLIPKGALKPGLYELRFAVGDWLDRTVGPADGPRFLDTVPIRFGVDDPTAHYHVPLLVSPFGYSTYRGS